MKFKLKDEFCYYKSVPMLKATAQILKVKELIEKEGDKK